MINYTNLFKEQLNELPESNHKKQLEKYGENIIKEIIEKSIVGIIADVDTTDKVEYSFHPTNCNYKINKTLPVVLELSYDLGVFEQFVLGKQINLAKLEDAIGKVNIILNNSFLNLINTETIKSMVMKKEQIFKKRPCKRILIVGNGIFGKADSLKPEESSADLKYLGKTKEGDVVFHSNIISPDVIFTIDLNKNKNCLSYKVKNPLSVVNNKFIHVGQMEILNPDLITLYHLR